MKVSLIGCSVILLIFALCGIESSLGTDVLDKPAPNSDLLIRERRDEDPQYGDDYDSGEQDRWPTLEELGKYSTKRRVSSKRGGVLNGPAGLYDLLSTKPRPAERRTIDSLKDAYVADLLKRHRMPRSAEVTTLKPDEDQPISERLIMNEGSDDQSG